MVKRRLAVILSPELPGRSRLCSIVLLSTARPNPSRSYHHRLELDPPLPAPYDNPVMWVKGDIVLTVAFHRLRLLFDGKDEEGNRLYDQRVLEANELRVIQQCVVRGLGMGHLLP